MSEQKIPLMDVKEVRTGISTTVFKKKTNGRKHMVHTYVSLIMPYGTVDIQCASEEQVSTRPTTNTNTTNTAATTNTIATTNTTTTTTTTTTAATAAIHPSRPQLLTSPPPHL